MWCHVCVFFLSQRKAGNRCILTMKTSMTVTNTEIQCESQHKLNCVCVHHTVCTAHAVGVCGVLSMCSFSLLCLTVYCRFRLKSQDQVAKTVRIGEYYLSKRKFAHTYHVTFTYIHVDQIFCQLRTYTSQVFTVYVLLSHKCITGSPN